MKKLIFFLLFILKNCRMFVMLNIRKGKRYACRFFVAGFFYACLVIIYSVTPVWSINVPTALAVLSNRSVALLFFAAKTNYSEMLNTEKNCLNGNNSTTQATPEGGDTLFFVHLLSAVQRQVQLETNIKNNLYAFILERGLYRELKEYSSAHDMSSPGGHARALVSVSFSSLQKSKNMEVCHE